MTSFPTGISAGTGRAEKERERVEVYRRRMRKEMRNENITHWVELWQSESLSEMVPHGRGTQGGGREMEWDSLPV